MTETVLALAGDVMLGRGVHELIRERGPAWPWGDILPELWKASGFFVNLECALTPRTTPWHDGVRKAFYFRSDLETAQALRLARVDFASVANNHIGDYGHEGILDTLKALDDAGIHHAGAGSDLQHAREPAVLHVNDLRVAVVAAADHPPAWAASADTPGLFHVAIATDASFSAVECALTAARRLADLVVFSIHWGPNMRDQPSEAFRRYARRVIAAGADVVWGHSAHVVQGIEVIDGRPVLYDTGDFVDDYAVDDSLRNDLSALFLLRLESGRVRDISLLPVKIASGQVCRAAGADREWFETRIRARCARLGTQVISTPDRDLLDVSIARQGQASPADR